MIFRASLLGNVFGDLESGKRLWVALKNAVSCLGPLVSTNSTGGPAFNCLSYIAAL